MNETQVCLPVCARLPACPMLARSPRPPSPPSSSAPALPDQTSSLCDLLRSSNQSEVLLQRSPRASMRRLRPHLEEGKVAIIITTMRTEHDIQRRLQSQSVYIHERQGDVKQTYRRVNRVMIEEKKR